MVPKTEGSRMSDDFWRQTYHYDQDYGGFVNSKHERVARIVAESYPDLELGWIPPNDRDETDTKPFALIYNDPNGTRYPVSYWREDEIDERILVWCYENDLQRRDPNAVYDEIKAREAAAAYLKAKEIEDQAAERWEFGRSLLKSPLHTYRHNGKVYRG